MKNIKWEYRVKKLPYRTQSPTTDLEDLLSFDGSFGWELVTIMQIEGVEGTFAVYKKPAK